MTDSHIRAVDLSLARNRLGRIGVWLSALGPLPAQDEREQVQRIEQLGYPSLWITESQKEAFAHAGLVLASTSTLTVATGIANIWAREPETAVSGADALADAYDGRFILGIGIGHSRFNDRYQRPLATTRDYLDRMLSATGNGPQPTSPVPWLVAALRPKMLELAATRAQGSHPYLVPPEHTVIARAALGPEALLTPELTVVLDAHPVTARATARAFLALYLTLPNYTNNLLALGFTDDDLASGGSDRLVDAVVAWGDEESIKGRVEEHLAAGADHVCIQPITPDGRFPAVELDELAPALLG
ncbi:MAG: LLM class F420-dependent oxidoreductase [Actinomycetota bacterium]|nr:LLM class F420-dependent oxidoreductase [Actinomycetota bacterium]